MACGTRCCLGASCGSWCCTTWRTHSSTARTEKTAPSHRSLFLHGSDLSAAEVVREYGHRWAVEIAIRDSNAFDGLGKPVSQAAAYYRRQHVSFGPGTARTLWFIEHVDRGMEVPLCRYRPWYRQKVAPSQLTCNLRRRFIPAFFPTTHPSSNKITTSLPRASGSPGGQPALLAFLDRFQKLAGKLKTLAGSSA